MGAPIVTPRCPECDRAPAFVLADGHQAFCQTDSCRVLAWDTYLTAEQNRANSSEVDLGGPPTKGAGVNRSDFEQGLVAGLDQAALLAGELWESYTDPGAKAALGLLMDKLHEQAAALRVVKSD